MKNGKFDCNVIGIFKRLEWKREENFIFEERPFAYFEIFDEMSTHEAGERECVSH